MRCHCRHVSQDKQSLKSDIRITVHDGATLAPIMSENCGACNAIASQLRFALSQCIIAENAIL